MSVPFQRWRSFCFRGLDEVAGDLGDPSDDDDADPDHDVRPSMRLPLTSRGC